MIALTAGGTAVVLSVWLYSNYRIERSLFVGTVERSLFNVLQNYYQREVAPAKDGGKAYNRGRSEALMAFVAKVYPGLDLTKMKATLDTTDFYKHHGRRARTNVKGDNAPDELLPLYLLARMDFNAGLTDSLEHMMKRSLRRSDIDVDFELMTQVIPEGQMTNYVNSKKNGSVITTRPILVNPEGEQYLLAKFDNPWLYFLSKMAWRLVFSLILLIGLVGTFMYLLETIRRQNQLANLRKAFVNNMTHELKTPVATVMAAVEALQRFVAKDDTLRMQKYLALSKTELEHLSVMIEKVIEVDVDNNNRIRIEKQAFDLVPVVQSCMETAEIGSAKAIEITLACDVQRLLVRGDEPHIRNVISNLLDNAIKYSDEPVSIAIALGEVGKTVEIRVSDTGKGIAEEDVEHLFEPFFRAQEGNLHDVKGFGLGLSYVKQVVEQHEGSVSVKSDLGKGSLFIIRLPK